MQKLAVLGNSGGGKTTLSQKLATRLGIPYFSVDSAIWNPATGWVPGEEVNRIHSHWLSQQSWIIDGWGDFHLIEQRLAAADNVILIEYPLWRHCWWASKRECSRIKELNLKGQPPAQSLEQTWQLMKAIRWVHRIGLPWLKNHMNGREAGSKLINITSPHDLSLFIKNHRSFS